MAAPTYDDMVMDLSDAAPLEGCEVGNYWRALVNAYDSMVRSCECSPQFEKALNAELKRSWKRLQKEFRVTEEEVTRTVRVRSLEFIG